MKKNLCFVLLILFFMFSLSAEASQRECRLDIKHTNKNVLMFKASDSQNIVNINVDDTDIHSDFVRIISDDHIMCYWTSAGKRDSEGNYSTYTPPKFIRIVWSDGSECHLKYAPQLRYYYTSEFIPPKQATSKTSQSATKKEITHIGTVSLLGTAYALVNSENTNEILFGFDMVPEIGDKILKICNVGDTCKITATIKDYFYIDRLISVEVVKTDSRMSSQPSTQRQDDLAKQEKIQTTSPLLPASPPDGMPNQPDSAVEQRAAEQRIRASEQSIAEMMQKRNSAMSERLGSSPAQTAIQPPNFTQSELALLQQAAEQGNADAQFVLAGLYALGHGVAKDEVKSAQWLEKAAVQGHRDAQKLKERNAQGAAAHLGDQPDSPPQERGAVIGFDGLLLGGFIHGQWVKADDLQNKDAYKPYRESLPDSVTQDPGSAKLTFIGNWNADPRQAVALNVKNAVYSAVVKDFLARNGLPNAQPAVMQIFRADLEGDGADEVVICAQNIVGPPDNERVSWEPDKPLGAPVSGGSGKGGYSIVLLRKIVDKEVITIPLRQFIDPQGDTSGKEAVPTLYKVHRFADLNGDGIMEIITGKSSGTGLSYGIHEIKGNKAALVLENGRGNAPAHGVSGSANAATAAAPSPFAMHPGPSFDCAKAITPVELAICADPQLTQLDRAMAATYTRARDVGNRQTITAEQRQWIQAREAQCAGASNITQCVQQHYMTRLQQLGMHIQQAATKR